MPSRFLDGTVRSFQSLVEDMLHTEVLEEREARRFLQHLVYYDEEHASTFRSERGDRLDYTLADSQIEMNRDYLRVNDAYLKCIGLKQLPGVTGPTLLDDLLVVDSDLIVSMEWKPKSNLHMRRVIRQEQTGFDRSSTILPPSPSVAAAFPSRSCRANTRSKRITTRSASA
ncbi:MAG: hypothetical protein WAM39_05295 [Bryobacteraceae bacterium]